jgi:ribonuclease J
VYLGAATQRILREATFFTRGGADLPAAAHLANRVPLRLGPFTVTPFLMDHSALDAYALLIDAGGKRLLYSGDVRAHGRKTGLFERFIADPPSSVDALLLEGTNTASRASGGTRWPTSSTPPSQ